MLSFLANSGDPDLIPSSGPALSSFPSPTSTKHQVCQDALDRPSPPGQRGFSEDGARFQREGSPLHPRGEEDWKGREQPNQHDSVHIDHLPAFEASHPSSRRAYGAHASINHFSTMTYRIPFRHIGLPWRHVPGVARRLPFPRHGSGRVTQTGLRTNERSIQ